MNSKTENSQIFRRIFGKVLHMLVGWICFGELQMCEECFVITMSSCAQTDAQGSDYFASCRSEARCISFNSFTVCRTTLSLSSLQQVSFKNETTKSERSRTSNMEQARSSFMRLLESALSRITVSYNFEEVLRHLANLECLFDYMILDATSRLWEI